MDASAVGIILLARASSLTQTANILTKADLDPSCTLSTVAMCKATPAHRAAQDKEVEYVSACDMLVQAALTSPSSLDMHAWTYGFGQSDMVVIERRFDSQNAFGATISSRYRCEIDTRNNNVKGLVVRGPMGTQRII